MKTLVQECCEKFVLFFFLIISFIYIYRSSIRPAFTSSYMYSKFASYNIYMCLLSDPRSRHATCIPNFHFDMNQPHNSTLLTGIKELCCMQLTCEKVAFNYHHVQNVLLNIGQLHCITRYNKDS
jgi:hypothetical protein